MTGDASWPSYLAPIGCFPHNKADCTTPLSLTKDIMNILKFAFKMYVAYHNKSVFMLLCEPSESESGGKIYLEVFH